MSCGHCVASVKSALSALESVDVEQVEIGRAVVSHDPAVTSTEVIAQAVEDEGYAVVSTENVQAR
jgi:copper chaperone